MTERALIAAALRTGGIIDITTTGRRSGQPRRIEIVFFNLDGRVYITGLPGRRAWLANLASDPQLTFHLKKRVVADLPARARIVTDEAERRPVLTRVCEAWNRQAQTEAFIADSPLIEVLFEDETLLAA
jgi:deazaflavin-dependent oxidoreductase (nitroreductase family)